MSAGSLIGMVINFIIFGFASSVVGLMFDKLHAIVNLSPGILMDAVTTISNLHLIYLAGPFLYALALGYNHMVVSNNESDQVA